MTGVVGRGARKRGKKSCVERDMHRLCGMKEEYGAGLLCLEESHPSLRGSHPAGAHPAGSHPGCLTYHATGV